MARGSPSSGGLAADPEKAARAVPLLAHGDARLGVTDVGTRLNREPWVGWLAMTWDDGADLDGRAGGDWCDRR